MKQLLNQIFLRHPVRRLLAAVFLFSGVLSAPANAVPISVPGLFNTGVDASGTPQAIGSSELHWGLSGPISTVSVIDPLSSWSTAPAGSAWIGPASGNSTAPTGLYVYSLDFDLTGIDISNLSLSGIYTSDNNGEIFLNSVSKGFVNNPTQYFDLWNFEITSGFSGGINTLEFRISNNPGTGLNPTGLVVANLAASTTVPEPATLALMGLGLAGLRFARRKKI